MPVKNGCSRRWNINPCMLGSGNRMLSQDTPQDKRPSPDAYLLRHPVETLAKPIAVTPGRATIGRAPENTIVIDAQTVSRKHAVIVSRDGKYYVNDLDSHNGTFINGKKINISTIEHHDRISFGNLSFLFLRKSKTKPLAKDRLIDANSTISLNRDELDPSDFLAYAAENARAEWLPREDAPFDEAAINPFKQAHRRLSLLYELSERLRSTQNLKQILTHGLDLILEAVLPAQRALVLLQSGPGGTLEVAAGRDRSKGECGNDLQISRTLLDWVLTEKMALMSQNLSDDIRLKDSESLQLDRQKAVMCVPIIAGEKVIGALYVDSDSRLEEMTQEDTAFAVAVANELALTIANIRLQQTVIHNERMAAVGLTVSNLAHNIKNLTMINRNAAEMMQINLDRLGDPDADKCWKIINDGISKINRLAMDMLAYVGSQPLAQRPTDVNRAIRAAIDGLAKKHAGKGFEISLDLSPSVAEWEIDEMQFQQALVNLVVNAIDAVGPKENGSIRISSAIRSDDRLVVAVEDNGCGMSPEDRKKIFELFFTTKGSGGNGLGLPMVSKFIESSGAKLMVTSKKDDGSTFKMIFPPKS